jgi:hypothetical protein
MRSSTLMNGGSAIRQAYPLPIPEVEPPQP